MPDRLNRGVLGRAAPAVAIAATLADTITMKLVALITLALAAGIASGAPSVPFCEAVVPEKLITQMKDAPRWESDWSNQVILHALTPAAQQALFARYKGRVPKPKLEAIQKIPPMYPIELSQKKTSGQVTAYLVVARNGSVKAVYVTDYAEEAFAKAAALSLKLWTFARLKQECLVAIPVPFTVEP
jgi:outer membrane biosynthesis protein TonB